MINVLLVDDHELIRLGIGTLLSTQDDIELVGEACSFQELIFLSKQTKPDIILLDLHLKDGDVTSKIPEILKHCPSVLILTAFTDCEKHLHALRLGSMGIVTKHQGIDIILKAIRTVSSGELWIGHSNTPDLLHNFIPTDESKFSLYLQ
jgi:DNA-binding NarL/FixJ family response regulator